MKIILSVLVTFYLLGSGIAQVAAEKPKEELGIFTASYVLEHGSVGPLMGRGRIFLVGAGFKFGMVDNAQIQVVIVRAGTWRGAGETLPAYQLKAFAKIGKGAKWEKYSP